jgi:hypothetical protein
MRMLAFDASDCEASDSPRRNFLSQRPVILAELGDR